MASRRLIRLRELADKHRAAGFVVNFSSVEVFIPDPEAARAYIRAVFAEFGRSVRIEQDESNGVTRLCLSLGPDTREPKKGQ